MWLNIYDQKYIILYRRQRKNILKKNRREKAKWLSQEALQIDKAWKEMKSKGESQTYIKLNAEIQRREQRDKKVFYNEECIKPEENN